MPPVSDDFSDPVLNSIWNFSGIAGSADLGVDSSDGYIEINSPEGVAVNASGVLTTPRLLQDVDDVDLQISASFLSEPSLRFQEQGLLVVQDNQNWIRFDLAFTGVFLKIIVGVIEDGQTTYPLFRTAAPGTMQDLRIAREGDDWTFSYSQDGETWTPIYSLTHEMEASQLGFFAGSTAFEGAPPGYTARVDYFESASDPLVNEDGDVTPVEHAPAAGDDALETAAATALAFDAEALLVNDTDADGDALTVTGTTAPANGTLTRDGASFVYTPAAGFAGTDSFDYTVSDGALEDTATVRIKVGEPEPPAGAAPVSDDFSDGTLDAIWTAAGPAGVSVGLGAADGHGYLEL
uniref:Ig-like domain-containing protein n=1 Tax=uncultured Jannaschia sp. TaxID=293347 RepID=UPI002629C7EE